MLTSEEVFQKAFDYDFDAIKDYLEQGGNPEIFDEDGDGLLWAFLDGYYRHVYDREPDEVKFLEEHDDDEEYYTHVHKFARMPLEERPHPIKEQMDYLLAKGVGVNSVDWEQAEAHQEYDVCVETPLVHSVVKCDYCMTKYLLEHGADPAQRLFSDGDYERLGYEDWLLDHLDIYIMNGDHGDAGTLDVEIAALLMHYGLDQWPGGYCIDVDKENRTICGHSLQTKF